MADIHYFDIDIARKYGIHCAVLLQNIWHWVRKNEANNKNFHDGYYWTYNSTKAFQELFPYLSQKQIETALKKLRDEEILKTGNYNAVAYDRTLWYTITEKGKSILHTGEMEVASQGNGFDNEGKPIPNINTGLKPNNKKKERATSYDKIIDDRIADAELKGLIYEFIKMRKMKKKPLTDRALTIQLNKLLKISADIEEQKQIVETSIVRCWDEFYPLKKEADNGNTKGNTKSNGSEYSMFS